MNAIFFIVSLFASTLGAVTGIGGGIIIKPVLDATGLMRAGGISFLSGCTVLSMTSAALVKSRRSHIKTDKRIASFLAAGAAVGGVLGKRLFDAVRVSGGENAASAVQSSALAVLTVGVIIYLFFRDGVKSFHITNRCVCGAAGLLLGVISSFLGIGGGPVNLAALYLLFSMDTKTAAMNSIYIIFFSQLLSLLFTLIAGTVPPVGAVTLILMSAGGVCGGLTGGEIMKRISVKGANGVLIFTLIIVLICVYNFVTSYMTL